MKLSVLVPIALSVLFQTTDAIELTIGDKDSVCDAATSITDGIMDYYLGTRYGGTVGMFQQPYYWWESGLAFGSMIDTWKICNNDTYVEIIQAAIENQKGETNNFMVANQSDVEANDDQLFWGFTVMQAAERNFPEYGNAKDNSKENPSYAQLALNVYNSMAERWDDKDCSGGLRWQIFSNMSGWNYKSTISNAGVFALGARLARYTNETEFVQTSSRILRWMKKAHFISKASDGDYYNVYDGSNIKDHECPVINGVIWSYNYAVLTMGCAYLYNTTNDDIWKTELSGFMNGIEHYFLNSTSENILYEYQCNVWDKCNNDQRVFKAIVADALGKVVELVPNTEYSQKAQAIINASAIGAAKSCSGGTDGKTCGMNWAYGGWDGWYGLGEQINALEVIQNTVIDEIPPPCTEETCGEEINDDVKDIVTVPAPTVTTYVTDVNTSVETQTVVVSTIKEVFY